MPPRLDIWAAFRSHTIRTRPLAQLSRPQLAALTRNFADDASPPTSNKGRQNGSGPPQGSSEHLAKEKVLNEEAIAQLELTANGLNPFDATAAGHRFPLPNLPLHSKMHIKHRYDPIIDQLTRLLMRNGKLSKAQRDMAMVLNYLRMSPPPKINPARPLLPGAPLPEHLPLNPNLYLTLAIDSVAPLVRIRGLSGLAGSGKALEIPSPLAKRQRRRQAFMWIMDTVNKKHSMGSGRRMLAHRIGDEIVAVMEGRSEVWKKRDLVHKAGTVARANMNAPQLRGANGHIKRMF